MRFDWTATGSRWSRPPDKSMTSSGVLLLRSGCWTACGKYLKGIKMTLIVNRMNATHLRRIPPVLSMRLKTLSTCQSHLRASWCLCQFLFHEIKRSYLKIRLFILLMCPWALHMRIPLFYHYFLLGTVFAMTLYVLWFCIGNDKRFIYQ